MHVLERPAPAPDATASYADHACGIVDLFHSPTPATRAPVILIHGGFWRARYDRTHLRSLAAALAGTGREVALPEYRRVGDPEGGWPGSLDDVSEILRTVPALLDAGPGEVVVAGHSAGGHLAVLAASAAETGPALVVSLAGVLDIAAAHAAGLSGGAVAHFLGRAAPTPAELAAIDPMAQPVPGAPVTLVHGTRDDEVPAAYSTAYAERDERIRLVLLDADHYDLIDPLAPAFAAILEAIDDEEDSR